jgi:antitoxin component of RelBE/YafQ-DinJ toxin-antitoxin module
MSEAVRLFIRQVNIVKGLPFKLKLTDEAAKEHDLWFKDQVESVLKKVGQPGRSAIAHEEVSASLTARQDALRNSTDLKYMVLE